MTYDTLTTVCIDLGQSVQVGRYKYAIIEIPAKIIDGKAYPGGHAVVYTSNTAKYWHHMVTHRTIEDAVTFLYWHIKLVLRNRKGDENDGTKSEQAKR